MPALRWTAWAPVSPITPLSPDVLAETLDGGQAFRWYREAGPNGEPLPTVWRGIFDHYIIRLSLDPNGALQWSAPTEMALRVSSALSLYLDLSRDTGRLVDELPWRSDAHLALCLEAFPSLRILRQPFGETLLGFL